MVAEGSLLLGGVGADPIIHPKHQSGTEGSFSSPSIVLREAGIHEGCHPLMSAVFSVVFRTNTVCSPFPPLPA